MSSTPQPQAPPEMVDTSMGPPKRRLRNLLLDPRFQLKYTGLVVGVTLLVAGVLGYFLYQKSQEQTEMLQASMLQYPDLDGKMVASIQQMAEDEDRRILTAIVGAVFVLTFVLGCVGIVVTHRLVGPVYKLKRMFRLVAKGNLKVQGKLRKGDELQDVFEAFSKMVDALRERFAHEGDRLEAAIEKARAAGAPEESLAELRRVRDQMSAARNDHTVRL